MSYIKVVWKCTSSLVLRLKVAFPRNYLKCRNNALDAFFPNLHSAGMASTCTASIFFDMGTVTPLFLATVMKDSSYFLKRASNRHSTTSPLVHSVLVVIALTAATIKLSPLQTTDLYRLAHRMEGACNKYPEWFFFWVYWMTPLLLFSFTISWIRPLIWNDLLTPRECNNGKSCWGTVSDTLENISRCCGLNGFCNFLFSDTFNFFITAASAASAALFYRLFCEWYYITIKFFNLRCKIDSKSCNP